MIQPAQHIVEKRARLDAEVKLLASFCESETFKALDPIDRQLMLAQLNCIRTLGELLNCRIARFKDTGNGERKDR